MGSSFARSILLSLAIGLFTSHTSELPLRHSAGFSPDFPGRKLLQMQLWSSWKVWGEKSNPYKLDLLGVLSPISLKKDLNNFS